MKKLKGPDLKMPQLKVPDFLVDLYWDLRDRHLLPLVALGVVAIVAVPFLLGGDSEEEPPPVPHVGAVASEAGAGVGGASKLTVVEAKPGLRDYHKRLKDRSPTDPFEPRYTAPQLAGTKLGGGEGGGESSSTSTTTETTETKTDSTTEVTTESGDGVREIRELTTAIDVRITTTRTLPDGKKETSEPVLRQRVIPPAALPSEKTQAVAFMGLSPQTKKPMFLISDSVTAIFGEGKCLSGVETCQLLEVEPGMPEMFVFGPESVRYKIVVLNPRPVVVGGYERQ